MSKTLCNTINKMVNDCVSSQSKFASRQERLLQDYQGEFYGDEEDGQSSIVTREVAETVDANMVSMARVFQGAGDPVQFVPTTQSEESVKETRQKQAFVSHIIDGVEDSFATIHGALKAAQIYDYAVLEYGIRDKLVSEFHKSTNVDLEEITILTSDFEEEDGIEKVKIESKDELEGGKYNVEFRLTRKSKEYFIDNIAVDDFLITANVATKCKAKLIGKRFTKTRGDLIAEGFSHEKVNKLPNNAGNNQLDYFTFVDQGGNITEGSQDGVDQWAAEKVSGVDVFVKLYDNNDIEELRHVIKVGDEILQDEPADHINYAYGSAILMPNNSTGRGAADIVQSPQRVSTVVTRQTLDNLYSVNHPRHAIRYGKDGQSGVSLDDMLDIQLDGVVRTDGNPFQDIAPLMTPFIGDKSLMVLSYLDGARARASGSVEVNQALQGDNLNEETATRFNGIQDSAAGKIELQARVIGETLITQLWEGIAWTATRYQDTEMEIEVLGEPMVVDPRDWKFGHKVRSVIGTGASDNAETLQTLGTLYGIQTQLINEGSSLSDESKRYNTLVKMTKQSNQNAPQEFWNNPEVPAQVAQAENVILKRTMVQMEQAMAQNQPLIQMEQVKAAAKTQGDQLRYDAQMKQLLVKMEQDNAKLRQDMQQFMLSYAQDAQTNINKTQYDYTKLEVENATDIEGEGQ